MKVFAMYLPQFHRIPENDEWWGEGFTDWVPAKAGKPLFKDHYQPHIPMNNNYYDLMNKETMQWQANLMHEYGIDGMCMYHYWFNEGRQILEKPVENLLKWKDIDMPFCFYWANATWARSWGNIRGANVWAADRETEAETAGNAILMEQVYGDKKDWKLHFDYMLPFFTDSRYITIEEKPVLIIYKITEIPCLKEMLEYWSKLSIEAGLKGIYIIGARGNDSVCEEVDAFLIHEPTVSINKINADTFDNKEGVIEYPLLWEKILEQRPFQRKTYYSGVVGFDDTPRRGKKGTVINHATPFLFQRYLSQLMAKCEKQKIDIVFINAWNEWGEGMHLEPDEMFGTEYLEAVKEAKKCYGRITYNENNENVILMEELRTIQNKSDKFEKYLNLLDEWMKLKEDRKSLTSYFMKHGYKKVAIYGYGIFGQHLEAELSDTDVDIVCIVDKQKDKLVVKLPIYTPDEELPSFDVMVISSYYFYNDIIKSLAEKKYNIISIETIIKDIYLETKQK